MHMDYGWVAGGFLLSRQACQFPRPSPEFDFFFISFFKHGIRNFQVQSHKFQMLPGLSPCVRSKLTHELLEMAESHNSYSLKYPRHPGDYVFVVKLGLGLDSPFTRFFYSPWLKNWFSRPLKNW
jgi:hypothetical protein